MSHVITEFPVRIYWEDTDAGGIVYHSNYLKYMERARTDILDRLGVSQADAAEREDGRLFVVATATIRFVRPAKLGDNLKVLTSVETLRRASIVFHQEIRRGDELLVDAELRVGSISARTKAPAPIPGGLYHRMEALVASGETL